MSEPILSLSGVSKHFGGVVVLEDVSFDVAPGSRHALIGPNGAGKTTLFNLISGVFPLDGGTVRFEGQDLAGTPSRRRIGLALKAIGDDEAVAAHAGIDVTRVKLLLFILSATIITVVGAIQAPRWTYIEPSIVFNPTVSFLTLIMALLGGPMRLWGPMVGAIPLFLLFEWLSANFPDHFSIFLGVLFILIVFAMPNGVLAKLADLRKGAKQ